MNFRPKNFMSSKKKQFTELIAKSGSRFQALFTDKIVKVLPL